MQRLGLILAGVLLAFLALEVVLRVWDAVPEVGSPLYGFHQSDPHLGWRGKPNLRLRYRRPEFDALVELDGEDIAARPEKVDSNIAREKRLFRHPPDALRCRRVRSGAGVEVYAMNLPAVEIDNRAIIDLEVQHEVANE